MSELYPIEEIAEMLDTLRFWSEIDETCDASDIEDAAEYFGFDSVFEEPYESTEELCEDIRYKARFLISTYEAA